MQFSHVHSEFIDPSVREKNKCGADTATASGAYMGISFSNGMFLDLLGRIRPLKVGLRENFGLAEHTLGSHTPPPDLKAA